MIEDLHRFILVAKNGNITKTAEQIFLTQSALTQAIQRLEKNLDKKLFMHKGKTIQLTSEGTAIVEIGTKILELWEIAKNPQITKIKQPTFALGLFDSAALKLGKYFLQNSKEKRFNLDIAINSSSKLLAQLQLGILDVAICVIDKTYSHSNDIILVQTFIEKLVPVSGKHNKGDIKNIPFILYNKGSNTRNQIDEVFAKNNILPNIFAQSTSISFMKKLTMLGSGIALLPQDYIEMELKQGSLKKQKLPISFRRQYGLYIAKNGHLTKNHPLIKNLVSELDQ